LSGRRATDRATRFAPARCETPTQGQGREWAELNTRLPPLVAASFFAWPKAAQALGYSE